MRQKLSRQPVHPVRIARFIELVDCINQYDCAAAIRNLLEHLAECLRQLDRVVGDFIGSRFLPFATIRQFDLNHLCKPEPLPERYAEPPQHEPQVG